MSLVKKPPWVWSLASKGEGHMWLVSFLQRARCDTGGQAVRAGVGKGCRHTLPTTPVCYPHFERTLTLTHTPCLPVPELHAHHPLLWQEPAG